MSIVHVTGGEKSVIAHDRTLFVGPRVPDAIKAMSKEINKLGENFDKQSFRKLLQVAVNDFEGSEIDSTIFKQLSDHGSVQHDQILTIYSGLHALLISALKQPKSSLKQDLFKEDLLELKIRDDFIPDITSVVYGTRRSVIDDKLKQNGPHLPTMESFRWRVDVGISTSSLNRVLQPSILMETTLSDGSVTNFEVPVATFHQLRYSVANVLKEMEDLEKRSILKIVG